MFQVLSIANLLFPHTYSHLQLDLFLWRTLILLLAHFYWFMYSHGSQLSHLPADLPLVNWNLLPREFLPTLPFYLFIFLKLLVTFILNLCLLTPIPNFSENLFLLSSYFPLLFGAFMSNAL